MSAFFQTYHRSAEERLVAHDAGLFPWDRLRLKAWAVWSPSMANRFSTAALCVFGAGSSDTGNPLGARHMHFEGRSGK